MPVMNYSEANTWWDDLQHRIPSSDNRRYPLLVLAVSATMSCWAEEYSGWRRAMGNTKESWEQLQDALERVITEQKERHHGKR